MDKKLVFSLSGWIFNQISSLSLNLTLHNLVLPIRAVLKNRMVISCTTPALSEHFREHVEPCTSLVFSCCFLLWSIVQFKWITNNSHLLFYTQLNTGKEFK